jgi:predicted metal-dependent hydrolase
MSIEAHRITVGGLRVEVVRKAIKNLHLGVYPPHGRVRVAAPLAVSDDAVRLAVVTKMGWIKRQKAKFAAQPRQSERAYISGESHYFLGQRYRLRLVETARAGHVLVKNSRTLELHMRPGSDVSAREGVFIRWQRAELQRRLDPIVAKWSEAVGVPVPTWGVKRMKTKWGTCNNQARRIWINLEMIKKPVACLEYIVAHELAHLIEPNHSDRFVAILDRVLPTWRMLREELNSEPLSHEEWCE